MNTRGPLAGLASGVAGFLLGWVIFGLLLAWVCDRSGSRNAGSGLVAGSIVGFGVYASMSIMFLAFMNWYTGIGVAAVEVLANTVWSALMGAAAGLVRKVS